MPADFPSVCLRHLTQGARKIPECEAYLKTQRLRISSRRLGQPQHHLAPRGSPVPIVWNTQFLVARQLPCTYDRDVFPSRDAPPGGSTQKSPWEEVVNYQGKLTWIALWSLCRKTPASHSTRVSQKLTKEVL